MSASSTCALLELLTPAQIGLTQNMAACEQMSGYSTLQYGLDCYQNYDNLIEYIGLQRLDEPDWKFPDWCRLYGPELSHNLHDHKTAERYIIFHDCGKWACLTTDADGKRHFPNHAEVSQNIFREHFDHETAAKLIGWDMVMHTMKDADIDYWLSQWSIKDACTLMLASLAEIHANAALFGGEKGIESTSFKIKWKQVDKRGKAICKRLFGDRT